MIHDLNKKIVKFGEDITTPGVIKIIIVLGFIVFFNALFNQFVWDDIALVLYNPDNQTLNIINHFINQNNLNGNGYYRPFFTSYLALFYHLFGEKAFLYHFLQITLHIINTCLLFYFLKNFMIKKIALFSSIIFLVHPIQVESVAWISATIIPLSFLFGMLGLNLSIKEKIINKDFIYIFILLLLSVLTRETGFLFYPIILFYFFLFKRKYILKLLLIEMIAIFLYSFLRFGLVKVSFENVTSSTIQRLDFIDRLQNIPSIVFYYIKTFIFPEKLMINQMWIIEQPSFFNYYLPLMIDFIFILTTIGIGVFLYFKKNNFLKAYLFFSFWVIMGFAILIQIFPLNMTVADRWFYFPLAGLIGLVGISLQAINFLKAINPKITLTIALLILISLSFRTMLRNIDWYSNSTLVSHDIILESNFDSENNFGTVLLAKKDYKEALVHYKKSVALYPYETNLLNLGLTYSSLGKNNEAEKYYYEAYRAKSFVRKPHLHLESTYGRIANLQLYVNKNYREVERISKLGLLDYPQSGDLWLFLALNQYALGNKSDAIKLANKAYRLKPTQNIYYIYDLIINNASLKELGLN